MLEVCARHRWYLVHPLQLEVQMEEWHHPVSKLYAQQSIRIERRLVHHHERHLYNHGPKSLSASPKRLSQAIGDAVRLAQMGHVDEVKDNWGAVVVGEAF